MSLKYLYSALLILCLHTGQVFAQDWKKEYDDTKTVVFTKKPANSNVKAFKATRIIQGNVHQLMSLFMDWPEHSKWMYNIYHSELIQKTNEMDRYLYYKVKLVWPIKDRDVITRNEYVVNTAEKSVSILLTCYPQMKAVDEDCVRIRIAIGYWKFTQIAPDKVEIQFEYNNDPEGGLPSWLVNMFIVDVPLKSLDAVERKIKEPNYAHAKLAWIKF